MGLERVVGQVTPGWRADVIAVDVSGPLAAPALDPYSTLVYASRGTDVRVTMVEGEVLTERGQPRHVDAAQLAELARREARRLLARAGF